MIIHEISKNWYMILCSVDAIVLAEMVITAIAGVIPKQSHAVRVSDKKTGDTGKKIRRIRTR